MFLIEIGSTWPVNQQITFASAYVTYLFVSVTMVSGTLFIPVTVWNMSTGVEPWSGVMSTSSFKPHFLFRHRLLFILQFPFVCRIAFLLLCFLSCRTLPFFWFVLLLLDWPFSFRFAFNHQALLLFLGVFEWSNWRRRSRFEWLSEVRLVKAAAADWSALRWVATGGDWSQVCWMTATVDWFAIHWLVGEDTDLKYFE